MRTAALADEQGSCRSICGNTCAASFFDRNKNEMGKVPLRRLWLMAALAGIALLHGCAVVTGPGFDFADPRTRTSVTLGQYVPGDTDQAAAGVITPITPALIQAEERAKPTAVPREVARFFGQAKPYTIGPSDIITIIVY